MVEDVRAKSTIDHRQSRLRSEKAFASPDISIVVPVYNEAPNLKDLVEQIFQAMRPIGRSFEVTLIDDGSTDESPGLLYTIKEDYPGLLPAPFSGFLTMSSLVILAGLAGMPLFQRAVWRLWPRVSGRFEGLRLFFRA